MCLFLARASPCLLASVSRMKVVEAACGNAHTILLTNDGILFFFSKVSFLKTFFQADSLHSARIPKDKLDAEASGRIF